MNEPPRVESAPSLGGAARLAFKLGVASVLAFLILRSVNFDQILTSLRRISPSIFFFALVLQCLTLAISALRWQLCLAVADLRTRPSDALRIYLAANFIGTALPTGIGHDILRIYSVARIGGLDATRITKATASVVLDRVCGLAAFALFAVLAVLPIDQRSDFATSDCANLIDLILTHTASLTAIALGLAGAMLLAGLAIKRRIHFGAVRSSWVAIREHSSRVAAIVALSALIVIMVVIIVYILGFAVTPSTPISEYFLKIPLIALLAQLPLSILGIGVREAGFVFLFACDTASREDVLALSIIYFAVGLLANLIGGLFYFAPTPAADPRKD